MAVLPLLAACTSEPVVSDGLSCYPKDARRWLAASSGDTAPDTADSAASGAVRAYLDGSGSIAGYIDGATETEKPLQDLIKLLPQVTGTDADAIDYKRFGAQLADLDAGKVAAMQTRDGYVRTRAQPLLDNQTSRLDLVFADIAAAPEGTLSLVLSDLWLADPSSPTSGSVALARPLDTILRSGRGVAIYGVESPYRGRVSDWPGGRRDVTAARRHLFLLAIGSAARLDALDAELRTIPAKSIRLGLASGAVKHVRFAVKPSLAVGAQPRPFVTRAGAQPEARTFLEARSGVNVQQFAVSRSAAAAVADAKQRPPAPLWPGVSGAAVKPGTVWSGPVAGSTSVWLSSGGTCSGDDWTSAGKLDGGWRGGANGGYVLDPAAIADELTDGDYLVVGTLRRTGLDSPNPASGWMRDWSFDPGDADAAARRPVVPTLNLDQTAQILEAALARAARERPVEIGGFAVALRVEP